MEGMAIRTETSLPLARLDLNWTLSLVKWLCEEAELRALFVSEELAHAGEYAAHYINDNINCLDLLNPDAMACLVAVAKEI